MLPKNDEIMAMHKKLEKADRLSDMIPLMDVMDDNVSMITREGGVLQVLKLKGKDYSGLTESEKIDLFFKRKGFFEALPSNLKISVHYHRIKYEVEKRHPNMGNKYAEKIANLYDDRFDYAYRTDVYMVVQMADSRLLSKTGIPNKSEIKELEYYTQTANKLSNHISNIISSLEDYSPELVEHKKNGKSPLLSFWMFLLQGAVYPELTPRQDFDLNEAMAVSDIQVVSQKKDRLFSRLNNLFAKFETPDDQQAKIQKIIGDTYDRFDADYIITHNEKGKRYTAFVAMKSYPSETDKHIFDGIMGCQAEFCFVQHIKMHSQEFAKQMLVTKRDQWAKSSLLNREIVDDIDDCLSGMQEDAFKLADHSLSVAVHGDTKEECEERVRLIIQAFQAAYIIAIRERFSTEPAFWSQFPDYTDLNDPRSGIVHSITLSDMVNFGSKSHGNQKCSFGDAPVTFFKTPDGQNYSFTYHPTPEKMVAGHTMIFGSTGSGKTVFGSFLMMNLLRFLGEGNEGPLKQIIFDSLRGIKIPTYAFGGDYIDFGKDEIPLNPLQLPDLPEHRAFLNNWIAGLAGGANPKEENELSKAINAIYENLNPEERTLNNMRTMFGVPDFGDDDKGANLAARLQAWLPDKDDPKRFTHDRARYFNHVDDALSFKKRIVGFDMSNILKDEKLLAPLTSYIFHRFTTEVQNNPSPHVCFMDEAIQYMKNPLMYPFIEKFLREHRKLNGVFVGAVQSPSLMMGDEKVESLLSHIQTYVIFPDSTAVPEDYIGSDKKKGLGLTESEFKWVRQKQKGRQVLVKRNNGESVILDVDLSSMGDYLTLLKSDRAVVDLFEDLYTDWKKEQKDFEAGKTVEPTPWQEILMEKA